MNNTTIRYTMIRHADNDNRLVDVSGLSGLLIVCLIILFFEPALFVVAGIFYLMFVVTHV
jgi:hypothetical protein